MMEKNKKALTEKLLGIWLYISHKGDVTWQEEQLNTFSIV